MTTHQPTLLPAEFPGAVWYGEEELEAALRVLRNQSPFRYYGPQCGFEVQLFEAEFARFLVGLTGARWPSGAPGSIAPLGSPDIHWVGTFGEVGIFSLQINRNITAGEGGMIGARDPELHRRIEALRNAGFAKDSVPPENWYGDVKKR